MMGCRASVSGKGIHHALTILIQLIHKLFTMLARTRNIAIRASNPRLSASFYGDEYGFSR